MLPYVRVCRPSLFIFLKIIPNTHFIIGMNESTYVFNGNR